jgi:hypothetical protein
MFMTASREDEKLNCLSNGTIYRNMVNAFGKVVVPSQALETDLGPPPYTHTLFLLFFHIGQEPRLEHVKPIFIIDCYNSMGY